MTSKKVLFWLFLVFIILGAFTGTTTLQLLPLMAIAGMLAAEIWANKKLQVPALVLSIFMVIINIACLSVFDVALWAASTIIFSLKKMNG